MWTSFNILNLFSQLLDLDTQIHAKGGQCGIIRFGTKRIGFARKFLRQKIELAADGAAVRQKLFRLRHVRG